MGWELIIAAALIAMSLAFMAYQWRIEKAAARDERQTAAKQAAECPHIWGEWEPDAKGNITSGGSAIGYYYRQSRTCDMCGQIDLKTTKSEV